MRIQRTMRSGKKLAPVAGISLGLLLPVGCSQQAEEAAPPVGPSAEFPESVWEFGEVVQGPRLEHVFVVENKGSEELRIEQVEAPEMFTIEGFDELVQAGQRGEIRLGFETAGRSGSGVLQLAVKSNDPENPIQYLSIKGRLVPLIEIQPQNRVYFFEMLRGEFPEKQVTVINHQDRPLKILEVKPGDPNYFATTLETVEPGQEYRLTLRLDPASPAGALEETISLTTDSPEFPSVPIYAQARIHERVRAEPERVVFSRIRFDALDVTAISQKRVRISKHEGVRFEILDASTDVPFLDLKALSSLERSKSSSSLPSRAAEPKEKCRLADQGQALPARGVPSDWTPSGPSPWGQSFSARTR